MVMDWQNTMQLFYYTIKYNIKTEDSYPIQSRIREGCEWDRIALS